MAVLRYTHYAQRNRWAIVWLMSDPRFTRNTVQIVLRVPRDVADEAKKLAASRGETLTATIVDAMRHAWALSPPSVRVGEDTP